MLHPLVRFVLNHVASDYVHLYKAGNAPPAERYAEVWSEHAEILLSDIFCTEFRLKRETKPTFSIEDFLKEHPACCNNEDLLRRLIDIELAPVPPSESPTTHDDITADGPAATGAWTPELAKSIEWSVKQSAQEDGNGTTVFVPQTPAPSTAKQKEPDELTTFTISDSLTVEKFLGKGFWKDVYKAKQHSTQQFVALKHLREKNDDERAALIREVRTQAALTHQNIPPVFALDILPTGQAIVVEKLVDGSRWSDTIKERTLDDNLRILLEVANAVAFAHQQHKIIHRDLKPDNVVINDKYSEVYLIDWGLAADVGDEPADFSERVPHVSQLDSIAGTPLYWAPEQADGTATRCCLATDVFLLGALLYEILTGYAPYRICDSNKIDGLTPKDIEEIRSLEVGPTLRAVRGIIIPPRLFAPNRYIPKELLAVAMKSLSLLPEDRYTDAGGFIDAVKQYQHFAIITNRCDQNWKQFNALRRERDLTLEQPDALLSLTLRFLETSDIFRNVASEFQLHQIANAVDSEGVHSNILDAPRHPTLLSAQRGEIEARTELIALTLRSGDLTLADAQIGLVENNPFHDTEKVREMRHEVQTLQTSRRRARMMKWVAIGLVGILLGTSALYSYWITKEQEQKVLEYQRAEDNLQKARSAVKNFFTSVAKNPAIKDAGLMELRRELLNLAQQYHEDFMTQKSNDPEVIADQVNSLFDMAGIVTQFGYPHDAIDYYLRAVELGNELTVKYPNNDRYLDILAKCYKDLAVVYGQAQFSSEQVLDSNLKALEINRRLVDEFGNVVEYHRNLARILHNLGVLEVRRGNGEEAETYFRDSIAVRDGMTQFDDPPEYHLGKAQTYRALAVLHTANQRFDEADQEFELALFFLDELYNRYPERFRNDEHNLRGMVLFGRGGMKFAENQPETARSHLLQALEQFRTLVEKSPEHVLYQTQYNNTMSLLFECLVSEGKDDEALALYQQRVESLLATVAIFPDCIQFLCKWHLEIADFHLERGRNEEAIQTLQNGFETLDILEERRTHEEEELWKIIRDRLQNMSDEQ